MFRTIRIVPKPWGQEQHLMITKKYALKILEIKGGHRFSLQYHRKKMESWYVLSGEILVTLGKRSFKARPRQVIHVPPRTRHRIKGLAKWNQVVEVSTTELGDVVRLQDDYNREGTSAP